MPSSGSGVLPSSAGAGGSGGGCRRRAFLQFWSMSHGAHAGTAASASTVAFDDGMSPGSAPCRRMPCWMSSADDVADRDAVLDGEGGGDADGLAHGHARRDLARHLLRLGGGRVVAAGDQQLVHFPGQQRAVRVVVVAAAGHGVGEVAALRDVVLGHDVLALQQPGLPDAHLGGDVEHVAVLEAGQVGADVVHGLGDPVAGGELGGGHVRRVGAVEAGHVRGVAPDHAVDGGLEPPQLPGPAEQPLDLAVDGAGFLRVGLLEGLGRVGVHVAEAEDQRGQVVVLDVAGAGPGGDVDVAGGVDDDVGHERLRAGLGLADDALDHAVVHDGAGEPGVQAEVHAGLADQVVGDALPAVGVEGHGVADGLRVGVGVEVEGAVAAPLVPRSSEVLRSSAGGTIARPSFCSRSTYSETMPVTVISWPLIMSSRTRTMPPEARPPRRSSVPAA